jgi:hypothetical protein
VRYGVRYDTAQFLELPGATPPSFAPVEPRLGSGSVHAASLPSVFHPHTNISKRSQPIIPNEFKICPAVARHAAYANTPSGVERSRAESSGVERSRQKLLDDVEEVVQEFRAETLAK